jgi:hypothetical protein
MIYYEVARKSGTESQRQERQLPIEPPRQERGWGVFDLKMREKVSLRTAFAFIVRPDRC